MSATNLWGTVVITSFTVGKIKSSPIVLFCAFPVLAINNEILYKAPSSSCLRNWWKKFWYSWPKFVLIFHVLKIAHIFVFLIRVYFIKMILQLSLHLKIFFWQIRHIGDDGFVGFFDKSVFTLYCRLLFFTSDMVLTLQIRE